MMIYLLTEVELILKNIFDLGIERNCEEATVFYACHVIIIIAACFIIKLATSWSDEAAQAGSVLRFILALAYPLAMTLALLGKKEMPADDAVRAVVWTIVYSIFLYVFGGMIEATRLTTKRNKPGQRQRIR